MKEVIRYICETCNKEYDSKHQCKQCEKSHKNCKKETKLVQGVCYFPAYEDEKGYPKRMEIKFHDGKKFMYCRDPNYVYFD